MRCGCPNNVKLARAIKPLMGQANLMSSQRLYDGVLISLAKRYVLLQRYVCAVYPFLAKIRTLAGQVR